MKLDSGTELKHLKVDGGMTNGDLAMQVLADIGGFGVVRPEMREYVFFYLSCSKLPYATPVFASRSTALGSALLAGSAIKLFGWNLNQPATLSEVNTKGSREFIPSMQEATRAKKWEGWQRAVERSKGWEEGVDEGA